jgi:WD40 repeat protein
VNKPSSWTKPVIQIAAAGLGAAVAGPLGGAIGGWLGDALGSSAKELVSELGRKFGEKAGEKLLDTGADFLLDQLADSPANLDSLYRDSLRLSLESIRDQLDPALSGAADWFVHWNICLTGGVPLDLPALQAGDLAPVNLDHLFRRTLERLDAQGNAISLGSVSLNLAPRTLPPSLLAVLNLQLPALLNETFAALIVTDEYNQAWKQTSLKFEHVTVTMLKGLKEDNKQLMTGLAAANQKLDKLTTLGSRATPLDLFATVPPLPSNLISRPEITRPLIEDLRSTSGIVGLTAIEGMGGIGKTVIANEICHDPRVRETFSDGILWFTFGKQPNLTPEDLTRQMAEALNQEFKIYTSAAYRSLFIGKSVLVVLDDVWTLDAIQPFLLDSGNSRLLYTTRVREIAASLGAKNHNVGLLNDIQARIFLARWSGCDSQSLPEPQAREIIAECNGLVLGLAMIGATLRNKPATDWARILRSLKRSSLRATGIPLANYAYGTLYSSISASVDELSLEDKVRYLKLAILLEDMPAPAVLLQQIWGGGVDEVEALMSRLVDVSLANFDADGSIRLHDFQIDFLRGEYPQPAALALEHSALLRSLHVVRPHPEQFASQLIGRLISHKAELEISTLLKNLDVNAPRPLLRPLWPALEQAGSLTLRVLEGHVHSVRAVTLSADGRRVVSGSDDKTLRVWDLEGEAPPRLLQGHTDSVRAVALSADGRRAVSGSADKTLRVWDLEGKSPTRVFQGHTGSVNAIALSADGRRAVSGSDDKTLRVWDLEGKAPTRVLLGNTGSINAVALSADGRRAVSGSDDGTLRVWNLESKGSPPRLLNGAPRTRRWQWRSQTGSIEAVALSADGKRAVSGSDDGTLHVWDLEGKAPPRLLQGHTRSVRAVALDADGGRALSGSADWTLRVWDLEGKAPLRVLEGHTNWVSAVALSADGRRAVSGSDDGIVRVWDLEGKAPPHIQGHTSAVWAVALSADGRRAISGSGDGTMRVWEREGKVPPHILEGHTGSIMAAALSADGKRAVSGSIDKTLRVWDLEGKSPPRVLEGHTGSVLTVALSADGRRAISGSNDKTLRVWDLEGKSPPRILEGHTNWVSAVALSTDGGRAVSGSFDKTVRVWDLEGKSPPRILEGHADSVRAVAFSADGRRVVSGSNDETLRVWDLEGKSPPRILEGHTGLVFSVALSPDDRLAVSGSGDKTLRAWHIESRRCLAVFTFDYSAVSCSWRGNHIAAGDLKGRVHMFLWET